MATTPPRKPQGNQPKGKKNGSFVDPLNKWAEDIPDLKEGGPTASKPGQKPAKVMGVDHEKIVRDLIENPDQAADKITALIRKLGSSRLSSGERVAIRQELNNARKSFTKMSEAADKLAKELKEDRRLQASAHAKLNRLRNLKGNTAGFTQEDLTSIQNTEKALQDFIKMQDIFRKSDNHKSEDVRKEMMAKFNILVDAMDALPVDLQQAFKKEDAKLEALIKSQQEARAFVQQQNDAIRKVLWKAVDKIGFGAFNLGNAIRVGRAVYNAPRNLINKGKAVAGRVNSGIDYVQKTIEMRRLAKASIVPDIAGGDSTREAGRQTEVLKHHAEATERFHTRLLDRLGHKQRGAKPKDLDTSLLDGFKDLFGAGGFLKSLLKIAGSLTGVAIAGAIGYWIGSKIWKAIEPAAQKVFNNVSGLDAAGASMSAPAQINNAPNFTKAQAIHKALQTPGTKVSGADEDFYAQFRRDNPTVDLDKAYAPTARQAIINQKLQASGASMTIPAGNSTAGAGRGSVNPPLVNSGSTMVEDWVGKTISKNGDVSADGLRNLNGGLQANLVGMSREYYEATGKKLNINSGFRSMDEQAQLYRSKPKGMAAAPGTSLHNFGFAVDIPSQTANELQNLGLLQKYGFVRPVKGEPWHLQPSGVTVTAARAGVYSADAPLDQGGGNVAAGTPQAQTVASAEPRIPVSPGGNAVAAGSDSAGGGTIGAGKKTARDIPTFDSTDGHLLAMNLGVIA